MIKVLVVDDSAFMRQKISEMLDSAEGIEVIGIAKNGESALTMLSDLNPDVVTLDLEMPIMNGLTCLKKIMKMKPTPVVIVSAYSEKGSEETIRCLEMGAVDFVAKPDGKVISKNIDEIRDEFILKIRGAAKVKVSELNISEIATEPPTSVRPHPNVQNEAREIENAQPASMVIAIASSTGGPNALRSILPLLPKDLSAAILIAQHMPEGFTGGFAQKLNRDCALTVKEAANGMPILNGEVYIGKGGHLLSVAANGRTLAVKKNTKYILAPSADYMMTSVAENFLQASIGLVLTGIGDDGCEGLTQMRLSNSETLAQDRESCVVYGMPKSCIEAGVVDRIVPLNEIASVLIQLVKEGGKGTDRRRHVG